MTAATPSPASSSTAAANGATTASEAAPARRRRRWPRVLLAVIVVALVAMVGISAWWLQPQPNLPEATAAMASTSAVTVSEEPGFIAFTPTAATPTAGFIFYPGGKVEPAAYARSAQAIAEAGYLVAIVPMPLNLAVLNANGADAVIAAYPDIDTWVIGGHSLGGAMAGQYVDQHPGAVDGLALWAAYPNGDLSDQPDLPVLSIYGSLDGGAERFSSAETKATLPADTRYVVVEGGNHEQMGDYTGQPNDPPATISRDDQQAQVQAATIELLDQVSGAAAG
ncbi:MAG: alpha/beta hydrolase [Chloroflexota bacterium]